MDKSEPIGHYRWIIAGLLFLAATINYIDRQVLSILAPDLQRTIGWSEIDYGNIVFSFQIAYALMLLVSGRIIDLVGTRVGFALAISWWSLACMGHALAASVPSFGMWRFLLGMGEAGNFPASIKSVAEWFPKRERALVTGIFNSGTNIGAILAPIAVPLIALHWGWQAAFIATGSLGFFWVICWLLVYRPPEGQSHLSARELAYIRSDPSEPEIQISWIPLLQHRQLWAFALGKFLTDPVWWFYLYWLPKFLSSVHGIKTIDMMRYLVVVYLIADVGSVAGGWFSSALLKSGWSTNRARKTVMFLCSALVAPVIFASQSQSPWGAIFLISLAAAAHQGWSANLFTLSSDMFPREAVASVVGIGGFAGALGGMLIAKVTGHILEWYGTYTPMFVVAGLAYLVALAAIQGLCPRLEKISSRPSRK